MLDQNTTTVHHPWCVKCRKRMAKNPNVYGGVCTWLKVPKKRQKPEVKIDGDEMLKVIDSNLRGYPVEMREELRQEIALAIMSMTQIGGVTVTLDELTPAIVKEIA